MTKKSQTGLPVGYGGVKAIAEKLGISQGATGAALKSGRPRHPVVVEALSAAKENCSLEGAQTLAMLKAMVRIDLPAGTIPFANPTMTARILENEQRVKLVA